MRKWSIFEGTREEADLLKKSRFMAFFVEFEKDSCKNKVEERKQNSVARKRGQICNIERVGFVQFSAQECS